MKVSVFGLGYVGAVSAGALARNGHQVIGVDPNLTKVEMVAAGASPVIESGLDELIAQGVSSGAIRATTSAEEAIAASELSMICVGTPSNGNGSLDLTHVEKVCQEIGSALAARTDPHVVVVRSTMLPGSTEEIVIPTLEAASGRRLGPDLGICVNPEFLREGSSIKDFFDPAFTLIGGGEGRATDLVRSLYAAIGAPVIVVPYREAEMIKYASNAFHALKITFANEIGNIAREQGIDSHRVMEILCRDTNLNISPAYLRPGFAFGGSCLPKDLRALVYQARRSDVDAPVLEAIARSNQGQIDRALTMVMRTGHKRVGVLGFSFKAGTDDLRESPMVELIERLIGKGYELTVFDRNVSLANLQGANREYIEREIPHIASLMAGSVDDVLAGSDVVVIGNGDPEFVRAIDDAREDQVIVDLVRIGTGDTRARYEGICW
ncbi:MAG TPA: nucleotide sugar dehydrogenase [Actinomycetota bacterium]|nr:nucleotide sugar dehydrogenase [Actinomycetota bacterium]